MRYARLFVFSAEPSFLATALGREEEAFEALVEFLNGRGEEPQEVLTPFEEKFTDIVWELSSKARHIDMRFRDPEIRPGMNIQLASKDDGCLDISFWWPAAVSPTDANFGLTAIPYPDCSESRNSLRALAKAFGVVPLPERDYDYWEWTSFPHFRNEPPDSESGFAHHLLREGEDGRNEVVLLADHLADDFMRWIKSGFN